VGLYPKALANTALRDATRAWLSAHQDAALHCAASCSRISPTSSGRWPPRPATPSPSRS
jgi:hypothetical protein